MRMNTPLEQAVASNSTHHLVEPIADFHPANQIFNVSILRKAEHSIELDIAIKDAHRNHSAALNSLLGCAIDCGVRMIPTENAGEYELSEYELTYMSPWRGEPLVLRAHIEMEKDSLAVFCCELQLPNGLCVVQAQGTLLTSF